MHPQDIHHQGQFTAKHDHTDESEVKEPFERRYRSFRSTTAPTQSTIITTLAQPTVSSSTDRRRQPITPAEYQQRSRQKKANTISDLTDYFRGFGPIIQQSGNYGAADKLIWVKTVMEREFVGKMKAALMRHHHLQTISASYNHIIDCEDPALISKNFWELFGYLEREVQSYIQSAHQQMYGVYPTIAPQDYTGSSEYQSIV